jgi:hypothetical protein
MSVVTKKDLEYYLYNDSRPHSGISSPVQKGLVPGLQNSDARLCEEGLGFGVPILQYARDFYFPGSAETTEEGKLSAGVYQKCFQYNLIERTQKPSERSVRPFSWVAHRVYNRIYKSSVGHTAISIFAPPNLKAWYGIKLPVSKLLRVRDRGWSCTTYALDPAEGTVKVTAELDRFSREGLQQVYVSNEMGGHLFTHYFDSRGLRLRGEEIGGWSRINAKWVIMHAPGIGLGFRIDIPPGIAAFRGRETFSKDVSWSGVIFSVSPSVRTIEYGVRLDTFGALAKQTL